jgi:hypothetical protein
MSIREVDVSETLAMAILSQYKQEHQQVNFYDGCEPRGEEDTTPLSEVLLTQVASVAPPRHALACTFLKRKPMPRKAYVNNASKFESIMSMYAIDLVRHCVRQDASMVERYIPSSFPLFVDLDIKAPVDTQHNEELHMKYIKIIQNTLLQFFPGLEPSNEMLTLVCCTRHSIVVRKDRDSAAAQPAVAKGADTIITHGYHLHWPHIIVDSERAFLIRESVISRLSDAYPRHPPLYNSWEDVVDGSVYKNGGLRSIGSYKFKRDGTFSQMVNGEGVTYWPTAALRGDGAPHRRYMEMITRVLHVNHVREPKKRFSIQEIHGITEASQDFNFVRDMMTLCSLTRVRVECPLSAELMVPVGAPRPKIALRGGSYVPEARGEAFGTSQYRQVVRNRERVFKICRDTIRQSGFFDNSTARMHYWWPEIQVADVLYKVPKRGSPLRSILVSVQGNGSSFCLNLNSRSRCNARGADHRSNRVYFIIGLDQPNVQQRCHCNCDTIEHRYRAPGQASAKECKTFTTKDTNAIATGISSDMRRVIENVAREVARGPCAPDTRPGKKPRK